LRRAAHVIELQRQRGGAVQVCCALGFSRSAAATACWLLRSGHAATLDDALALLRRARPQIVLSAAWLQVIEQAARPVAR
jgi:protein-tyrosine phosphatase